MGVSASLRLGGLLPARACAPKSIESLAQMLGACDRSGEAVVLFGGGTLQGLGAAPARYDVAMRLTALSGIVEYEPRDFTVAVLAGTTLADFSRTLRAERQFVPIDAPRAGAGTVGGALAAGWMGPRRRTYGAARDLVIGSTAVLPSGTVAKAGGMVVKNVSGYDMSKLYVGSLGTLAALAQVNFKTLPLPQVLRGAIAPLPERTRLRAIAHVRGLAIEPTLAVAVRGFRAEIDGDDREEGRLILLFEGSEAAIGRAIRDLRSALGAAGVPETKLVDLGTPDLLQRVVDAYVAPLGQRSVTYRDAGLPSDVEARAGDISDLAGRHHLICETICDLHTGDVIARVSARDATTFGNGIMPFDDGLHEGRTNLRILHAPDALRRDLTAWSATPSAIATMRTIKEQFDPRATLAPGRFVGGM